MQGYDSVAMRSDVAQTLEWWRAGRPVNSVAELQLPSGPMFQIVRDAGAATSSSDARRKIEQG